jgi:hypothetical protein
VSPRRAGRRSLVRRLAFASGVALVALELAARGVEARAPVGPFATHLDAGTAGCARPSLTRIYEIAGRCGRDGDGFLLDHDRPLRQPGALRMLVVGDSVGEQSWTLHLGDALADRLRVPVEVWNTSVGGYGTCQEAAAAAELLPVARPDVVVVETCPNDVFGSPVVLAGEGALASAVVAGGLLTFPRVLLRSALFRVGLGRATGPASASISVDAARSCAARLVDSLDGVPFVVVHFPALVDDPDHPALVDERAVARAWADVPAIRLRDRIAPLAPLRESPDDLIHPRETAQARIAAALVDDVAAAFRPAPR